MRIGYLLGIAFLIVTLSSCRSIKLQDAKTVDIVNNIFQYPTVANLDVQSDKVVSTITFKRPWYANSVSRSVLEMYKGQVVAEAVKSANADVLLEPQFLIEQGDKKCSVNLTVSGYPAMYRNFRAVNNDDIEILKLSGDISNIVSINKYQAKVVIKKNVFQTIKGWFKNR